MIYNLAHNGNKLITFTIDGTTYQAIDGMTWGEWLVSSYNTDGFFQYEGYVVTSEYQEIGPIPYQRPDDVIYASGTYAIGMVPAACCF